MSQATFSSSRAGARDDSLTAPGLLLQRKCACGQHTIGGTDCASCSGEKQTVQRKALHSGESSAVPRSVHEVLNSPGQPLDAASRAFFEPRFGHDFSDVKLHTDGRAAESARAVNAQAYTVGRDVVLGAGLYRPETAAGRSTLAHELTHVVQQRGAARAGNAPLEVGPAGDAYEQEADSAAHQVSRGAPVRVQRMMISSSVRRLQRQALDTHAGIFEQTKHNPVGGPTFVPRAQYVVKIEFLPYDIVNCTQVALTQTGVGRVNGSLVFGSAAHQARALTAAEGTQGVGIDRLSGSTSPLFGTANTGVAGPHNHFGSHIPAGVADRAWLEDTVGADGATPASSRSAGGTESFNFETCATCAAGTDQGTYYGCVSWGHSISATNVFTEAPFARISRGTPSADFIAAAKKWNAQTVPVATTDLPVPTHRTNNNDMTKAELDAEITTLQTTLKGLAAGHADIAQITFELRMFRDIRDSIKFNEDVVIIQFEVRDVQKTVGAKATGVWNLETVQKLKIWQARHGVPTTGRIDAQTKPMLNISRLGDFPEPSETMKHTA